MIIGTLEQGLIFALVVIGVYITYRILDFPDLSVDGTFPLGAAVGAICLNRGMNPFLALLMAFLAGCVGGGMTAFLHVKLKISSLLSGILVMIALYSINLRIMGKSNIQFFAFDKVFDHGTFLNGVSGAIINKLVIVFIFVLIVKVLMDLFLKTKLGFLLKFVGDNETLVTTLGVNKDTIKTMGLMLSNGIVALGGALQSQYGGFADVTMGTGVVVTALAAVIIGEVMCKLFKRAKGTTIAITGAVVYKIVEVAALRIKVLEASDFKLITAIIVIVVLGINNTNFTLFKKKQPFKAAEGQLDGKQGEMIASSR
ncbi:putative ABC transport system permease protein [Hathewaya proteolytica DSM 3090]|uniref:Putative ABC transport system permease protein n=1 Tax=Hathewaya proteolytica DSM 3090 TaxID=1121331 RepID=A0A1M6MDN0_9CLOT|nr:ABC transporter permease [Hathewaya proteolytica]SHJ81572.1 putative ABC transport system permease protein [Hathewaya proteolytica DSM 3090]